MSCWRSSTASLCPIARLDTSLLWPTSTILLPSTQRAGGLGVGKFSRLATKRHVHADTVHLERDASRVDEEMALKRDASNARYAAKVRKKRLAQGLDDGDFHRSSDVAWATAAVGLCA